ncbi:FtsK/SpoIIIE domain-containing protein [Microbacterium sp. 1P10UB]|uniref:FtsK/SpoIIIE domain-containing protein n=1 Tax=unclassified Microbacterium TaxID=2609290 RepID=UPI0039A3E667
MSRSSRGPSERTPVPRGADPALAAVDEPIVLPPSWTPSPRAGLPLLASIVPVVGSVALFLVTGSVLALWLALLGPLIAGATMADGARSARRARRTADRDARSACRRAAVEVERRHAAERDHLRRRHPDAASFLAADAEVWRPVPGRGDVFAIGAGEAPSAVRISGGGEAARTLKADAAVVPDAPVLLPADTALAVVGPRMLADAVVRALVVQACSVAAPGELELIAVSSRDAWAERMPHRHVPASRALAVLNADDPRPRRADRIIVRVPADAPPPSWCAAVLTVSSPQRARLDHGGRTSELRVECLSAVQAADIAADLAQRAVALGMPTDTAEDVVRLADLLPDAPAPAAGGLRAALGRSDGSPFPVDLVSDGPHAVVAGVTGSGKSELLISWIVSLCAQASTAEASFLLADFKGGTAFDGLAGLPHVTGVITDLDGGGARRAIDSLRAEVRWRERSLADAGARDIRDPRVQMPRLVIVVDEFAALLGAHPELHAVFIDVAARGRALGMHLILGTQRVAGVVRESLLANCPLRVSLRVTDAADSRAVIGTDEAALLPGGRAGAGRALVRRAGDDAPVAVRIALAEPADVERVAHASRGPAPRRSWLPDLPAIVPLAGLLGQGGAGDIVLGIVDEPERQRQSPALLSIADRGMLVVGAAGSGKSTVLDVVAAQARGSAVRVPADAEAAWDTVSGLTEHPPDRGDVLVLDDLDALAGAFPAEYAAAVFEALERLIRQAGAGGYLVVAGVRRLAGPVVRLAELLPRRALLAMPSRADYLAAGGDGSHHAIDAAPGRGRLDGLDVQFAFPESESDTATADALLALEYPESDWMNVPGWLSGEKVTDAPFVPERTTAFVARRWGVTRGALESWRAAGIAVMSVEDVASSCAEDMARLTVPRVVHGEPEEWQRQWAMLTRIRGDGDLLVDSACAGEYRLVTGDRALPPYCATGRGRAWLRRGGGAAERVTLPPAPEPPAPEPPAPEPPPPAPVPATRRSRRSYPPPAAAGARERAS